MRTRTILAVLTAAAFSLGGLGTAGASNDSAHRPMKATTTIPFVITAARCGALGNVLEFDGVGTATHLGRLTVTGSDCIFFTGNISGYATNGHGTFTAANGDELYSTFTATFAGAPGTPVPVEFLMAFEGGTGRFDDATGHITGTGVLVEGSVFGVGEAILTWSGWIAY